MAARRERQRLRVIRSQPVERPHLYTVIMLPPSGADVNEFCNAFYDLESSSAIHFPKRQVQFYYHRLHWVFPSRRDERDWYRPERPQPSLQHSISSILDLIKEEALWVPRRNIFLGGVGEGMGVALAAFLTDGTGDFAGLIGLSGSLLMADTIVGSDDRQLAGATSLAAHMRIACQARVAYYPTKYGKLLKGEAASGRENLSRSRGDAILPYFSKLMGVTPADRQLPANRITPIMICNVASVDETFPASSGVRASQVLRQGMGLPSVVYKGISHGATPKEDIIGFIMENIRPGHKQGSGEDGLLKVEHMFSIEPDEPDDFVEPDELVEPDEFVEPYELSLSNSSESSSDSSDEFDEPDEPDESAGEGPSGS